jgi:hypothetical protein
VARQGIFRYTMAQVDILYPYTIFLMVNVIWCGCSAAKAQGWQKNKK